MQHAPHLRTDAPFVLMENRLASPHQAQLFQDPVEIVRCDQPKDLAAAFDRLEAGLAQGLHAAGFLAYELAYALEPRLASLMPQDRTAPLLWLGLFPAPTQLSAHKLDELFSNRGPPPPIQDLAPGHDRAAHVAKAQRVLELIAAGDIYQANLTFPIRFRYDGDPLALYAALRVRQPVAHGGVVAFDDTTVLCVSPELFLRLDDGRATSRPMKGTAARGDDPQADQAAIQALVADPKQRAENLMIVDLIRNDLARISQPGSVRTPHLFTVETYPTLHTLTSTVTSRLRPNLRVRDTVAALFPCGSIVGAPKIRAAEILSALEEGPRGVYTGAIGALGPKGGLDLNVAIRTLVLSRHGEGSYGVGGGIVADSDPSAEYDEALLKARVLHDLARPYDLVETFRWAPASGYLRLPRHLERLMRSAGQLGFVFDLNAAQAELASKAIRWADAPYDRRVRMSLSRDGQLAVTDAPAPDLEARALRIGIVAERLDAADPFLRHKTSHRDLYDRAAAQARAAGLDEGLLLNRSGDLADGTRSTLFIEVDGRLVTPSLAAGALQGVLRGTLLEDGRAIEGRVTKALLAEGRAIYVGNSLRGLQRAVLV